MVEMETQNTTEINSMKLGLIHRPDPRTLKLSSFLREEDTPALPDVFLFEGNVGDWCCLGNDTVADCTVAGAAHAEMLCTAQHGGHFKPTTSQVIGEYSTITGYSPWKEFSDNGARPEDVLNRWRDVGLFGRKITGYAGSNLNYIERIIFTFGFVYCGVNITRTAQDEFNDGKPWISIDDNNPEGGHCILIVGYDKLRDLFQVVTWGRLQWVTRQWLQTYWLSCHAVWCESWPNQKGIAANGLDTDGLRNAVNQVSTT